jgi:AsmA protein
LNQVLAQNAAAAASAATPAAPAETAVSLDGLTAFNGRVNLSAGQLTFRQYDVADAKLDAALDGGVLRITRLSGNAWGGSIDGSGSADAKSKRIGVKLVNALLKDVAGKDLLEGTGRVSADITTSGATLGALRSNLAGAAALQLRDGAVKGVNLARTLRQAKAALSMKQDSISKASSAEKTDFSELTASARIEGGVARSDDLDLTSARAASTTPRAPPSRPPPPARTVPSWPRCAASRCRCSSVARSRRSTGRSSGRVWPPRRSRTSSRKSSPRSSA